MTIGHLLAGLVFVACFAAAYRALSWFFRGVKQDDADPPITGYSDPVRNGRMRW